MIQSTVYSRFIGVDVAAKKIDNWIDDQFLLGQ